MKNLQKEVAVGALAIGQTQMSEKYGNYQYHSLCDAEKEKSCLLFGSIVDRLICGKVQKTSMQFHQIVSKIRSGNSHHCPREHKKVSIKISKEALIADSQNIMNTSWTNVNNWQGGDLDYVLSTKRSGKRAKQKAWNENEVVSRGSAGWKALL